MAGDPVVSGLPISRMASRKDCQSIKVKRRGIANLAGRSAATLALGHQKGNSFYAPYRYGENTLADDMEWATAELYKITGREDLLDDAQKYAELFTPGPGLNAIRPVPLPHTRCPAGTPSFGCGLQTPQAASCIPRSYPAAGS